MNGNFLVGIDGLGGIGKTAIAREVSQKALQEKLFDRVIWVSTAPHDPFNGDANVGSINFDQLLDIISRKLDEPTITELVRKGKIEKVKRVLKEKRFLLVLDNLETAKIPQSELIDRLRPFLNPSKALLTSRHQFQRDLYAVHLSGLDYDGTQKFVFQDAADKRIVQIQTAQPKDLSALLRATGGSPLALKLLISQLEHFDLDIVLQNLASPNNSDNETNEYIRFYKHIYSRSWPLLDAKSKHLLISMAHFVPGKGGDFAAVKSISNLKQAKLVSSISSLRQLSLLEVGEPASLRQKRYYLHPLTQNFVLSDIVNKWE